MIWSRVLCFIGIHDWYFSHDYRHVPGQKVCRRCWKTRVL